MKQNNRILALLLLVVLIFSFAGCAKCISTEYEKVTIVDKYHRGMWLQPICAGKVTTFVTHPAVWQITVEYNDIEYTVSGSDTYNKYKDKIGQTTMGKLETKTYDDGTVKCDIVSLE